MRFLPLLWHILKITRVFLAGDLLFLCQQMRREIWTFLSSAHCHCLIWRSYQSTIASKLVNNISINTFWRLSTVLNPIFLFIPCKMQLSRFNVKCYVTSNCFWAREKINKLNLSSMYTFQCYRNRPRKRKRKKKLRKSVPFNGYTHRKRRSQLNDSAKLTISAEIFSKLHIKNSKWADWGGWTGLGLSLYRRLVSMCCGSFGMIHGIEHN